MKILKNSISVIIASFMAVSLIQHSAYASSVYDDTINVPNTLQLSNGNLLVDITNNIYSTIANTCGVTHADSFVTATATGVYAITQWVDPYAVNIYWSEDQSIINDAYFYTDGYIRNVHATVNEYTDTFRAEIYLNYDGTVHCSLSSNWGDFLLASYYDEPSGPGAHYIMPFMSNWTLDIPVGYEGQTVNNREAVDHDEDALTFIQEVQQATSDSKKDTDDDGIDDYKESEWFVDRNDIFCNTDSTPNVCAYPDPAEKDIYVEVDWMNDLASNTLYKPTNTQLQMVVSMYNDEGINLYFDLGNYGGGNEISQYSASLRRDNAINIPDFGDYKNGGDGISANFDSSRQNIWRYLIYGNSFSTSIGPSDSTGWSEVIGDDLFISGAKINNAINKVDNDRAVANTIAHELGHTLCLSNNRAYFEQGVECIFLGIDNKSGLAPINDPDDFYNLINYESVMNYGYQLTNQYDLGSVEYSHGPSSTDNHNDWLAIKNHVGAFNKERIDYVEFGARMLSKQNLPLSHDGTVVAE